jgi:uncharacterized protein with GYD domain
MLTYIALMRITDEGAKAIVDSHEAIEEGIKTWQAMGGKLVGFYAVTGEYDFVAIGEAPSDQAAMAFALKLKSLGMVRTTTLRAFTREEFAEIVKKLP